MFLFGLLVGAGGVLAVIYHTDVILVVEEVVAWVKKKFTKES